MSFTCGCVQRTRSRCVTPLIQLCDTTSQIRLDLGSCSPCSPEATALIIRKGGCKEYETVCVEPEPRPATSCGCGCCPTIPLPFGNKRTVEIPKPTLVYPLHEVDSEGMSVFALDGKLKQLGYGRYHAAVMVNGVETQLRFDIDYVETVGGIQGIYTESVLPYHGDC